MKAADMDAPAHTGSAAQPGPAHQHQHLRDGWLIEPAGDRCLLIRLGNRVDAEVSQTVHAVTAWLSSRALPGVIDVVPAFTTVAVHYLPAQLPRGKGSASQSLSAAIDRLLSQGVPRIAGSGRLVEIPVCYGGEYGPDLDGVAHKCGISTSEVIRLHTVAPLVLYTFFFAPGTPFAGPLDPRLQVPRRAVPRTHVPAGSVAIANGISSIYPTESPGGWNLIGRTPWTLFDIRKSPPTRLQIGDRLQFMPITPREFEALLEPHQ
ncbi:5-oxoprolinase subunit PxpB [Cupriavidus sp. CV2]|uniref:5-oxoprolinase subunit PxpB n=1 Tax=Cupriavidus ulmosensis TaxID=3065913 RepID=UPI00296AD1BE|nr:5-oxoprolinase subunit PxpB [Cupriavidus sp. CV2]MDW3685865.1 5-oxoprolinase subunit PxpB [Cupriavidus sp. CV2]